MAGSYLSPAVICSPGFFTYTFLRFVFDLVINSNIWTNYSPSSLEQPTHTCC